MRTLTRTPASLVPAALLVCVAAGCRSEPEAPAETEAAGGTHPQAAPGTAALDRDTLNGTWLLGEIGHPFEARATIDEAGASLTAIEAHEEVEPLTYVGPVTGPRHHRFEMSTGELHWFLQDANTALVWRDRHRDLAQARRVGPVPEALLGDWVIQRGGARSPTPMTIGEETMVVGTDDPLTFHIRGLVSADETLNVVRTDEGGDMEWWVFQPVTDELYLTWEVRDEDYAFLFRPGQRLVWRTERPAADQYAAICQAARDILDDPDIDHPSRWRLHRERVLAMDLPGDLRHAVEAIGQVVSRSDAAYLIHRAAERELDGEWSCPALYRVYARVDRADPAATAQILFDAAAEQDFEPLDTLCFVDADEPPPALCDRWNPGGRDWLVRNFQQGGLDGDAVVSGDLAEVPIRFGPAGDQTGLVRMERQRDVWWLVGVEVTGVDQSDPRGVVNLLFEAAQQDNPLILETLCSPSAAASLDDVCRPAGAFALRRFQTDYAGAVVDGEVQQEGETATVPITFGPDQEWLGRVDLGRRDDRWYLLGIELTGSRETAGLTRRYVRPERSVDVELGNAEVEGHLDRAIIQRVIRQHRRELRDCYQRELQRDATLAGRVLVTFTIDPRGDVARAAVAESDLGSPNVEDCLVRRILRFQFPEPSVPGLVHVNYPFVFTSGSTDDE